VSLPGDYPERGERPMDKPSSSHKPASKKFSETVREQEHEVSQQGAWGTPQFNQGRPKEKKNRELWLL